MTQSRSSEAPGERTRGSLWVEERSRELASERAKLQASLEALRADQRRVLADLAALHAERTELDRELARAREHVASLDAAIAGEHTEEIAKEQELASARRTLERDRELTRRFEQEIREYQEQIFSGQERLRSLVKSVMRIQHKLWRIANDESGLHPHTRG